MRVGINDLYLQKFREIESEHTKNIQQTPPQKPIEHPPPTLIAQAVIYKRQKIAHFVPNIRNSSFEYTCYSCGGAGFFELNQEVKCSACGYRVFIKNRNKQTITMRAI